MLESYGITPSGRSLSRTRPKGTKMWLFSAWTSIPSRSDRLNIERLISGMNCICGLYVLILWYRQALRYIIRNLSLPPRVRAVAQLQLTQMHCYTRSTQIRNRCLEGGKGRGIFRDFRLSRVRSIRYLHRHLICVDLTWPISCSWQSWFRECCWLQISHSITFAWMLSQATFLVWKRRAGKRRRCAEPICG